MTETVSGSTARGAASDGTAGNGKAGDGRTGDGKPDNGKAGTGLAIERIFSTAGVHPYDEVTWERRDVIMTNWRDGSINFEQRGVEFPDFWSINATNIVTTKYFRGAVGTPQREWSLKQLIDRVAKAYRAAGEEHGYFRTAEDAEIFEHELTWALLRQVFSFNSPVWFNVGTKSPQQVSACFILSIDDTMDSILNWYKEEGLIFKGGSGAGVNLARIRSSKELLSSGGNASGPVSFMRGADASAGTIKSGGATRRAAKMVVLDVDHPDVEEFIETKAREEDKIRVLRDAGFDMDLGGADITSVQYQNANNSVRVSDEFMRAVEADQEFGLRARTTGEVIETVRAKELFRKMAQAAWECADPGIQYDDTINDWHTNPETGRITASNPCFTGEALLHTDQGPVKFAEVIDRVRLGESFRVYTHDATNEDRVGDQLVLSEPTQWMINGIKDVVRLSFANGEVVRCTPNHRFWTLDHGWVRAEHLGTRHRVKTIDGQTTLVTRVADGNDVVYNLTEPRNHSYIVNGLVVANCSEYLSLDNSSCNLASLNLMKFLRDDDTFDAQTFAKVVELVITAMDISICFAHFPTQAIGETTRAYRQLGIGYANLGAMLMATGHGYDSDGGRAIAASITSLMTGTAYKRSAELAGVVGPYDGYARNAEPHKRVMRKHAAANEAHRSVDEMDRTIHEAATKAWKACLQIGEENGWRNGQASLLAPTGTIGLAMDCDTTGVEPDLALVKFKKLVGGGSMQIVNRTVPRALRKLGYQAEQVEAIVEYIAEHGHVVDAPGLKPEHYEVFDCAMGERSIAAMGHVNMLAAIQPFLSGTSSKTVNLPETATVEDIEDIYFQGWKLGLKALAVYRDNCKVGQPLSIAKSSPAEATAKSDVVVEPRSVRRRLPKTRPSKTTSFTVGGAEGYMIASSYPDDGLGEVFLKMSKQGSTLAGMMDAFSIAISIALQYGVPLETYVQKFTNMRFEPAGMTDDQDIRMAVSIMDYIFRRLALDHLPYETRAALGIHTAQERTRQLETGSYLPEPDVDVQELAQSAPVIEGQRAVEVGEAATVQAPQAAHSSMELVEALQGRSADAPLCFTCGTKMRPAGSCYVCEGCGSTSGCS